MTVHTYYEPLTFGWRLSPPKEDAVLDLWRKSWEDQGFQTQVLGRGNAQAHPCYEEYLAYVSSLPTVNPKDYEIACWLRWLAMSAIGGGLMTDYDVMNICWRPEQAALIKGPACLDPYFCPCAVMGDRQWYDAVVTRFLAMGPQEDELHHHSDMRAFQRSLGEGAKVVPVVGYPPREYRPLLHVSSAGLHKHGVRSKEELIPRMLQECREHFAANPVKESDERAT